MSITSFRLEQVIPDSVSPAPSGGGLTGPKGYAYFADRQEGVCSRVQKDSLRRSLDRMVIFLNPVF